MNAEIETMTPADMHAEMRDYLKGKPAQQWKWIYDRNDSLRRRISWPAYHADGTLTYEGDHDEVAVLRALIRVNRAERESRSRAAKKAAITRQKRRDAAVYQLVRQLEAGGKLPGPRLHCVFCGRGLGDAASIERGIGSECWQGVLEALKQRRLANSA